MSQDIRYYFDSPEKFPIAGFLDGLSRPCEILAKAKTYLREQLTEKAVCENEATMLGEVHLHGNYHIGKGTVIYDDVTIIGPVYIGENCEIMAGAVIRPNTIIGDKCSVGHGSELKRCVMFSGAKVASLSFAGDTVMGASARIGSGVITANRRFDQGVVSVKIGGERVSLDDDFFGCVLGDYARIGANSVTQPGTHIGPYSWIYPMTNVRGFVPRQKRVYHPREIRMEDSEIVQLKP